VCTRVECCFDVVVQMPGNVRCGIDVSIEFRVAKKFMAREACVMSKADLTSTDNPWEVVCFGTLGRLCPLFSVVLSGGIGETYRHPAERASNE
jgi:hypothetical protein